MRHDALDPFAALGRMLWLACRVEPYRDFPLSRCEAALLPAIELGQFRLYGADDGRPLAFVTWALMSEAAEARHRANAAGDGEAINARQDWRSGDRLWFMDFVAPFGHARAVAADLRRNVFPNRSARGVRMARDGDVKKLGAWRSAGDPLTAAL